MHESALRRTLEGLDMHSDGETHKRNYAEYKTKMVDEVAHRCAHEALFGPLSTIVYRV